MTTAVYPTEYDNNLAYKFAFERQKLMLFNEFLLRFPHIFSHVHLEIHANQELSKNNEAIQDECIYVRLKGSKIFCQQTRCNIFYPRGNVCTKTDEPKIFKSGNTDIIACQPACFNIFEGNHASFNFYSDNNECCQVTSNEIFALGADDYLRTDSHPTPHVDTIGTGFDLADEPYIDSNNNETFHFKLNKYYCDSFHLEHNKGEGACEESWGQYLTTFVTGDTIYKSFQYGSTYVRTGKFQYDVAQPDVPPVTGTPMSHEDWDTNVNRNACFINPNIKLSDLGIFNNNRHLFYTTEYGWPGKLIEPTLIYQSPALIPTSEYVNGTSLKYQIIKKYFKPHKLQHLNISKDGRRYYDEFDILGYKKTTIHYKLIEADGSNVVEKWFREFIHETAPAILSDKDFYIGIGIDSLASRYKKFALAVFKRTNYATMTLYQAKLLAVNTLSAFMYRIMGNGSKFFASLLKLSINLSNPIGYVLIFFTLLDLILSPFDLFNDNNRTNQKFIDSYSIMNMIHTEREYGHRTVEYSPAVFMHQFYLNRGDIDMEEIRPPQNSELLSNLSYKDCNVFIGPDSVKPATDPLVSIKWENKYLTSLKKNSDNLTINWGENKQGYVQKSEYDTIIELFKGAPTNYVNYRLYLKATIDNINRNMYAYAILLALIYIFIHMLSTNRLVASFITLHCIGVMCIANFYYNFKIAD